MTSEKDARRYRVGYALAPKKVRSFIQPSFIHTAERVGIDLVQIDLDKSLIDQGPFDCLIHKLSGPEWTLQLLEFHSQNPRVVIIDYPDAIERVRNRISMLQVVQELIINHKVSLGIPKQVFVESHESISDFVKSEGMNFPVIAKPIVADGSAASHLMWLVFQETGLKELKSDTSFVLQEFVNHGGVIFKVYVAGKHVSCVKRGSLPDIEITEVGQSEKLLPFSQISNLTAHAPSDASVLRLIDAAEIPPSSFLNEVAAGLRQALRLNLFNFDMIRDTRMDERYLIIDVNYFPGYAKMPDYEKILTDFFLDLLEPKASDSCETS
ncbi:inositol-tetrakisphosphate 1-kinase 1 [Dorcoceras hygrometricum]|uniref:Inositol-tetrakisphosphate 1-kinase n=1 Tax=Dorcoceras hygrometricum TaxID=472368 RepID=A0A2Z7C1I9_9LAMI|nr:inositol-tetrakisphosphate 1-kinase 1 [Dorcoceras hygrometricum]